MLFLVEYQINHDQKLDAFAAFASMTADDDAAIEAAHGVHQIGRWHDTANARGVAIFDADSAAALHGSLMMWAGMSEALTITPVLDDAGARAVISANLAS